MTNAVITQTDQAMGYVAAAVQTFEGIERLANLMAKMGTMPAHLQGKPADCFRIVVQAAKWRMDPFAVAECTSLVHGKLCFEGKLIAAALVSIGAIEGRLKYTITGKGAGASIVVTGTPRGGEPVSVEGSVQQWATTGANSPWTKQPEDQLIYRGTRQWARRYAPEAILGVVAPDEAEEPREVEATVVPEPKPALVRSLPGETPPAAVEQPATAPGVQAEQQEAAAPAAGGAPAEPKPATMADLEAAARALYAQLATGTRSAGSVRLRELLVKWKIAKIAEAGEWEQIDRDRLLAAIKAEIGGAA